MDPADIINDIVKSLLDEEVLANDPDWTTFSIMVEVTPEMVDASAYRYAAGVPGRATPISNTDLELFAELQESTKGPDDATWTTCILKIDRDSGRGAVNFVYGEDAAIWRITPDNVQHAIENLRPRAEDFN